MPVDAETLGPAPWNPLRRGKCRAHEIRDVRVREFEDVLPLSSRAAHGTSRVNSIFSAAAPVSQRLPRAHGIRMSRSAGRPSGALRRASRRRHHLMERSGVTAPERIGTERRLDASRLRRRWRSGSTSDLLCSIGRRTERDELANRPDPLPREANDVVRTAAALAALTANPIAVATRRAAVTRYATVASRFAARPVFPSHRS